MLNTKLKRTSLVALAVVLMLSVLSLTAFADDLITSTAPNANDVLNAAQDALDGTGVDVDGVLDATKDALDGTGVDVDGVLDATKDALDGVNAETGKVETTGENKDDKDNVKTPKRLETADIVLLIIFGVAVIAAVIVCIIKREKVVKFARSIKSEFKKIVWSPWNQVRKNTIIVIVLVVALAVVIGVLDFLFGQGIAELKNLINPAA